MTFILLNINTKKRYNKIKEKHSDMNKYKQINKIHRNVFFQGLYHREVHTGTCTYMLKSTIGLYSINFKI